MSNTLSYTNGESWKTYWDKIEKPEREKAQVRILSSVNKYNNSFFSVYQYKM
jgi:hypothetical protein